VAKRNGNGKLTDSEEKFCQEYLVDLNATQAYRRVHPKAKTASAGVQAHRLLKKPKIVQRLAALQDQRAERTKVTQDDVIEGLKAEAEYRGENATHGARVTAWSWLGKHLAMFKDVTEVQGDLPVIIVQRDT
jgi:phage terminase small subunit